MLFIVLIIFRFESNGSSLILKFSFRTFSILKLFLFNWKKEYISSVSKDDPISWELSLTFNEYEPIMYRGVEEYPLNIEDVYDFINKYSDILLDKEEK